MRRKETKESFPTYVHGETFTTSERLLFIKLYKKQRGGMGANIFSMLCFLQWLLSFILPMTYVVRIGLLSDWLLLAHTVCHTVGIEENGAKK